MRLVEMLHLKAQKHTSNVGHNVRDGTTSTNAGRQDATQTCVSCFGDLA